MVRSALVVAILFAACAVAVAEGTNPKAEEAAIRQLVASYAQAFTANDVSAFARLWAEDSQYRDDTGEVLKGPKNIKKAFETYFSQNRGAQLKLTVSEIRFPSASRATTEGSGVVAFPDGSSIESTYVMEFVKRDRSWQLAGVVEAAKGGPNYAHLKDFEWMIGEWTEPADPSRVETVADWDDNKNFINSFLHVRLGGKSSVNRTQMTGWDPIAKAVKSWIFNSDGSFGEGVWSRDGSTWTLKISLVLPTGVRGTQTEVYHRIDQDTFTWNATGLSVDGKTIPETGEIKVTRRSQDEGDDKPESE